MSDNAPRHWFDLPHAPTPGTDLCAVDEIPDGGGKMLAFDGEAAAPSPSATAFRLLLLRSGETVLAYVNRCAHFGVPLAANEQQLILRPHAGISCNVHYARYRWHDGSCESGECAGESLLAVPVQLVDGRVRIGA